MPGSVISLFVFCIGECHTLFLAGGDVASPTQGWVVNPEGSIHGNPHWSGLDIRMMSGGTSVVLALAGG